MLMHQLDIIIFNLNARDFFFLNFVTLLASLSFVSVGMFNAMLREGSLLKNLGTFMRRVDGRNRF